MVQTRSKRNLQDLKIQDLLLPLSKKLVKKVTFDVKKIPIAKHPQNNLNTNSVTTNCTATNTKVTNSTDYDWLSQKCELGPVLTLDTESFRVVIDGKEMLLPMQIAYTIDTFSGIGKRINCKKRMFYVGQFWTHKQNQAKLDKSFMFTQNTRSKHEVNLADKDYPVRGMKTILAKMAKDMCEFKVATICGFNLQWDFFAFQNALLVFDKDNKYFDATLTNPFQNPNIKTLDLMHNSWRFYKDQLVKRGIREGIINETGKKNYGVKRGILTLEYLLKFFRSKYDAQSQTLQKHLADQDSEDTAFVLQCMLQDFDQTRFEYNVVYMEKLYTYIHEYCQKKYGWSLVYAAKSSVCEICDREIGRQVQCWVNKNSKKTVHKRCF